MKRMVFVVCLFGLCGLGLFGFTSHTSASTPIPPPAGCPKFTVQGTVIDPTYERAEYVGGLLRLHYRANPSIGGDVNIHFSSYDAQCNLIGTSVEEASGFDAYYNSTNFSIRFEGPGAWRLWDDDREQEINCNPWGYGFIHCAWTIGTPAGAYETVSLSTSYGQSFTSTAYPIVELAPAGNSSVVFIPGLEASRLYTRGTFFENQLWEPNRQTDIENLFMDRQGQSIKSGIYTRDIIDEVNVLPVPQSNIYKSFIATMDGLVADGSIAEWKALPYDWRYDYEQMLTDGVQLEHGNISKMVDEVLAVAGRSNSGKVTIIAHSNGGVVAKALITRLVSAGHGDLVDKLILVAVPQSGTPKAMDALLHGEDFGIIKQLLMPQHTIRSLAENSPTAFSMLPSSTYFENVSAPVIEFSTNSPLTATWRALFGSSIANVADMRKFLAGADGRTKPAENDVISPNVLAQSFIDLGSERSSQQDAWVPPANLKVVQIIGWGLDTLRGILYTDRTKTVCNETLSECLPKKVLDERPLQTTDGDKTVISYSADAMGGERYYLDLQKINKNLNIFQSTRDHSDILEIASIKNLLTNEVRNENIVLDNFLTTSKPIDPVKKNRLSVHSPVSINIYDSLSNHTGLEPNPSSDFPIIEEQIPNSQYFEFGEGKYISIPVEGIYTVIIKGTGLGEFDIEFEQGTNGVYSGSEIYSDIPVNPNTIATITISDTGTSALALDIDGDGTIDTSISRGYTLSASSLLDILEYNISQFTLSPKLQKKFDKKITLVRNTLTKKQIFKAQKRLDSLEKNIKTYASKAYITFDQAEILMGLVNKIKLAIT